MKKILICLSVLIGTTQIKGQSFGSFDGILNSSNVYEKVLITPAFPNGVSNLAVDFSIGNVSFWGYIELEITGTYWYQNTPGKLTKLFAIGINPNGYIYCNESRVSDVLGYIPYNISIGDFKWDAVNNRFVIPISHIVSTMNGFAVKAKLFSYGDGALNLSNSLSISPQYTLAALPMNQVYFNGNVGIGTTSPLFKFDVKTGTNERFLIRSGRDWGGSYTGIAIDARNDAENASIPLRIRTSGLTIDEGNVGIGTTNPGTYKLAVEGTIGARKLKITQSTWADEVFNSSYKLKPLKEVEQFIIKNKHLPDVPKEKDVLGKDIDVGDTQALLLKKIEELTLYIIDLEKKVSAVKEENRFIKSFIKVKKIALIN